MIQQITNNRTRKWLDYNDLRHITLASCFYFFHTNTMFAPYALGVRPTVRYYYVKRLSSNEYEYQLTVSFPAKQGVTCIGYNDDQPRKTANEIEEIDSSLLCDKNNEEKVLILYYYCYSPSTNTTYYNKNKLGFFILSPTKTTNADASTYLGEAYRFANSIPKIVNGSFVYKIVFSPKPGLFPIQHSQY